MTAKSNSFEGLSDGTTITTVNSGGASGDAFDVVNTDAGTTALEGDTALAAHGSVSARLATGGSSGSPYLAWQSGLSNTQQYGRAYFYLTANPASNTNMIRMLVGTQIIATVRVNSTGKVAFLYSSGTLGGTSSASIPLNQWFRLEARALANTTTGSVDVRCYLGADPDSTTITETLSVSNVNTGSSSAIDRFRVGIISSVTNTEINVDDMAVSDVDWLGPAGGGGGGAPAWVPPVVSPYSGIF